MICLASLRQWVGDGDGSKPGMSECQWSVPPDFCCASSSACKMQEHFEYSDAEPPAKFFEQAHFLFLPLFVYFWNHMSPRVSKDVPRSWKWFPWQGNREDFATKSLKKKTQKPTTPDDFQPSYFEKPLKQSPQEDSAEPCDHSHGMWARTEVSWGFDFQKQGRRTGV